MDVQQIAILYISINLIATRSNSDSYGAIQFFNNRLQNSITSLTNIACILLMLWLMWCCFHDISVCVRYSRPRCRRTAWRLSMIQLLMIRMCVCVYVVWPCHAVAVIDACSAVCSCAMDWLKKTPPFVDSVPLAAVQLRQLLAGHNHKHVL